MEAALNADHVFAALADATRRDIVLRALAGREGVAELAGHYPMSFAAVQKHVAVLERAGLVTKERTGRRKVVRTNMEGLQMARGLLDRYEALWRGRVERMNNLITTTEETDACRCLDGPQIKELRRRVAQVVVVGEQLDVERATA